MEREVRYCTTEDGVRIAYRVEGEGPPLLNCPGFVESFALAHLIPEIGRFLHELSMGRMLIQFDWRGTGLSQRSATNLSQSNLLLDLEAVASAAGFDRFALRANLTSGPVAITYAAKHPRRVAGLVLNDTFARAADLVGRDIFQAFAQLARANWEMAAQGLAHLPGFNAPPDVADQLASVWKQSTSGDAYAELVTAGLDTDVTELLPRVEARTLVLHHLDAGIFRFPLGQALAEGIPNARLIPLPGGLFPVPWEGVVDAINAFLDEDPETRRLPAEAHAETQGPFRTVLVTDIVGHTEMMSRLGDEKGREVLREHERITRDVLKAHDGTEVKTMGDGFMASFASVTRSVECAIALQRAFAARNDSGGEPLHVRVGLNAGEPIAEDEDLFGTAVIRAARIAAMAQGGEILVANVVRELSEGKGFLFADRGEHVLRGFEDPVRVFEISWRDES